MVMTYYIFFIVSLEIRPSSYDICSFNVFIEGLPIYIKNSFFVGSFPLEIKVFLGKMFVEYLA